MHFLDTYREAQLAKWRLRGGHELGQVPLPRPRPERAAIPGCRIQQHQMQAISCRAEMIDGDRRADTTDASAWADAFASRLRVDVVCVIHDDLFFVNPLDDPPAYPMVV